ncbi:MAG TPA: GNAT family N-acetyltransferase [Candidatus Nanoarchaeia archaeon]|nr:GNAT family N-acetyltransferase [Candidatus Nanoarchaeia archaeon]
MEIIELGEGQMGEWRSFLAEQPHLIFHTPEYQQFLRAAFPSTEFKCVAAVENGIQLILPIGLIRSQMLGNKVISAPFLEYGGFCGNLGHVEQVIAYLRGKYSKKYSYLEIRDGLPNEVLEKHLQKVTPYQRFVLSLQGEEQNWELLDKQKRKAIRKAEKHLTLRELGKEDIDQVYPLYLRNMKQFGSPPFAREYFVQFFSRPMGKCFGAFQEGKLCAALLGFTYQQRVHITIAVAEKKSLELRPNDLLHWEFIRWGIRNSYTVFDFGRVREESGQFRFKQEFGGELQELAHYYDLYQLKRIPKTDPSNGKYRFAIELWKKMPLIMQRKIGPGIREGLGI